MHHVLWHTADVHYTAAHDYDPARARFRDFLPFWEVVSGPLNAGTFGPNHLDDTFGPQLVYQRAPPEGTASLSPLDGLQFFGEVAIDAASAVLTVSLNDMAGVTLFTQVLEPVATG